MEAHGCGFGQRAEDRVNRCQLYGCMAMIPWLSQG